MTNPKGTRWETKTVNDIQRQFDAYATPVAVTRRPKAGQKHEADVQVTCGDGDERFGVVAWHRAVKRDGNKVRVADGERKVAVLRWEDFVVLLEWAARSGRFDGTVYIQNKATQTLNVTRTLGGLRAWMKEWL